MGSQETFAQAGITSNGDSGGSHRKLVDQKSGKFTFSAYRSPLSLPFRVVTLGMCESITTATDTAMLRVVMAAVEGAFRRCLSDNVNPGLWFCLLSTE